MTVYALVDCNNFYASCERLFRPDLRQRPIVVLSNNDGCIVARSSEAKALGIPMAAPYFKYRELLEQHGVVVFSSNYALYADMSNRVMRTLEELVPRVEVYSIDEAFLDLSGIETHHSLTEFGQNIRRTIDHWLGLPVCVGMAPTKTLAKLANHAAKLYPATGGVVDLTNRQRQRRLLERTGVGEIWGVGRNLSRSLQSQGIKTALQLADANPRDMRSQFSVVLERTVRELNSEPCLEFEQYPDSKHQIICSRSFGERVTQLADMREAVREYASRAAEKLRAERQCARFVSLHICTSRFSPQGRQYAQSASKELPAPSNDSRAINQAAAELLQHLWRDGYHYAKAGVMLSDLCPPEARASDLFEPDEQQPHRQQLMQTLDTLKQKGRGRIGFGLAGDQQQHRWMMHRQFLSPGYTTRWSDLPRVI